MPLPGRVIWPKRGVPPVMVDVALFIPSCAGGGAERVAFDMAEALARRGLAVDLVVAVDKGVLRQRIPDGPRKICLGAITEILALPQWLAYLRRERPALVIAMVHTAQLTAALGSLFRPEIPFISSFHLAVTDMGASQWWFRRWFGFGPERRLHARACVIHAVSHGLAAEVRNAFGLHQVPMTMIGNPVAALPDGPLALEHEALFASVVPIILGIGRLVPQKNFAGLIRAFARLCQSRPDQSGQLVILGEGPERSALMQLAAQLGIADRVILPGFVDNPQAWLRRARLFVLSSQWEGFSLAVLEALLAGTPVVATDCRHGPAELLDNGRFGRLVPVAEDAALAMAMADALASPGRVDQAALDRHLAQFDPDRIADLYLALIRSCVAVQPQTPTIAMASVTAG